MDNLSPKPVDNLGDDEKMTLARKIVLLLFFLFVCFAAATAPNAFALTSADLWNVLAEQPRTTTPDLGYEVEIVALERVPGGIELMVKAWDAGLPVGFGHDGTVEIERFRILNPPTRVPDGTYRTWTDSKGEEQEAPNYVEDVEGARLRVLEQAIDTISTKQPGGVNIEPGKIGRTTTIVYASMDGVTARGGTQETWAQLRGGNGTSEDDTSDPAEDVFIESFDNGTTEWFALKRGVYVFDTSGIPDADVISAATLSFYASGKAAVGGGFASYTTGIVSGDGIASDTSLAAADYQALAAASTEMASRKTYGDWTISAYNGYVLDADGLAHIDVAGKTRFAHRVGADIDNSPYAIPGAGDVYNRVDVKQVEASGTTNDPKLTIEHAAVPDDAFTALPEAVSAQVAIVAVWGLFALAAAWVTYKAITI